MLVAPLNCDARSAALSTTRTVFAATGAFGTGPFGFSASVGTAKFESPYSPVFMTDGSLFVADYEAGTVTKLAPGKHREKRIVLSDLAGPVGLVRGNDQTIYISEYDGGRVLMLDLITDVQRIVAEGLSKPEGLALTRDGQLLVAETGTQRLLRVDLASGVIDVVAENLAIGLVGGEDLPAPFLPTGIAVDSADNIYVSADIDNAIYKLSRQ